MHPETRCTSEQLLDDLLAGKWQPGPSCGVADLLANRRIAVYGCGDGLITFSTFVLEKYGIRPEVLLDRKFDRPTEVNGLPAMAPSDYHPPAELLADGVAVITVGKSRFHEEIITCLRQMGFRHVILASDIYEYHLSHTPTDIEQLGPAYFREHAAEIRQAFALLADAKSRRVFAEVLQTYVGRRPLPISHDPLAEQYFPADVPLAKGVRRTINCGAFDGDTVRQLHAIHGQVEALVCFEPDPSNFAALDAYLAVNGKNIAKSVIALPFGLYSSEMELRFTGGNRINSSLSDDGDIVVRCVAIDQALPDFHPTFINMDIEGAEPEALRGAERTIVADCPDLAICVYHQPAHLWSIARDLQALVPSYRFYLRNYTGFPAETVLYATQQ